MWNYQSQQSHQQNWSEYGVEESCQTPPSPLQALLSNMPASSGQLLCLSRHLENTNSSSSQSQDPELQTGKSLGEYHGHPLPQETPPSL